MAKLLTHMNTEKGRIESFGNFVLERERIRVQKEEASAPRPWTTDPILQHYHFCNVRRADDRVTRWIGAWAKANWRVTDRWFGFCIARWFNSPETLADFAAAKVLNPWSPHAMSRVCVRIKAATKPKRNVFRGSYIMNSAYDPTNVKYDAVIRGPLMQLHSNPPTRPRHSIELCHKILMQYVGHGSFMAGQIVADWQTFGIIDGQDVNTWAPIGPGSNRGLANIFRDKYKKRNYLKFMIDLRIYLLERDRKLANTMSLHDVQNCLCEFGKYVRGYSKTRYEPFETEGFL